MITEGGILPLALKFLQVLCVTKRKISSLKFDAVASKQVEMALPCIVMIVRLSCSLPLCYRPWFVSRYSQMKKYTSSFV